MAFTWPLPNDVQSSPDKITSRAIDGVRVNAYDITTGASANPVVGSPANDDGDPPFILPTAPGDTVSNCAPTTDVAPTVTRTLWYEIVPGVSPDIETFPERTVVSLDAVNSTYTAAIEVFAGLPGTWNPGDPAPANIVACSLGVGGSATEPYVSFQAAPGIKYYAVVGSMASGGQLSLNIRESDVQTPALTVSADSLLPNPGDTTHFSVMATDNGSGLNASASAASAAFRRTGAKSATALHYAGDCAPNPPDLSLGSFCEVHGGDHQLSDVYVRWPATAGTGVVKVSVADFAGNRSPTAYTLNVADRIAPTVLQHSRAARWRADGALVQGLCSESGWMVAEILNANNRHIHNHHGKIRVALVRRSSTRYLGRARFGTVGHGFFTVKITCQDRALNAASIYTFLYVP
jgi:hypothetical protein